MIPRVSIVVACYFKRKYIPYMLNSIRLQTEMPYEVIIVVDDTAGDVRIRGKYPFPVRVLSTGRTDNRYRTSVFAMNLGIREARGDVVAISSCETLWGSRNIERIHGMLEGKKTYAVYASVFYFQMRSAFMFREVLWNPDLVRFMRTAKWRQGRVSGDDEVVRQTGMTTGLFATWKDNFMKVGGFDEKRAYWGDNDINLNDRLKLLGLNMWFDDGMFGIHLWHRRPPKSHVSEAIRVHLGKGKAKEYAAERGIRG